MSHTNVDSNKTYHIVNYTTPEFDLKERTVKTPLGGVDMKGKDAKSNFIEVSFTEVSRLIDDDGKTVLAEGTLQEVKSAEEEIKNKRKATNKIDGKDR